MSFRRRGARSSHPGLCLATRAGRVSAVGVALATLLGMPLPRSAAAEDGVNQCMQSYEAGQRLRREGDLIGAASELLVCGGPACPVRMQGDCQRWLDDVERATPAVVFRVREPRGTWLSGVSISIDGAAAHRLDGRAIAMNPGEHVIVFQRAGYRPLKTPVIVAEGEKLERRVVTLESLAADDSLAPTTVVPPPPLPAEGGRASWADAGAPAAPAVDGPSLWGPLALGAVAVAGGVGFAYFGVRAQSGEADLEQCTPNCTQARVDDVKEDFLRSNVSLGIGLAGLVGAGLWLLIDRPALPDGGPNARSLSQPRAAFGFGPTPSFTARF